MFGHTLRFKIYRMMPGVWVTQCLGCRISSASQTHSQALAWTPLHVYYHATETMPMTVEIGG